jgi:hypothetical protein
MKRSALSSFIMLAIVVLCAAPIVAAPVSSTGRWKVDLTAGGGSTVTSVATLHQAGQTVVGTFNHNTINGHMVSDTKMNGTWNGPRGAGWITLYFSADGSGFHGTWGLNGAKADGSFVAHRILASPAPTASAH